MSAIENQSTKLQIMPRISFRFPSTMSAHGANPQPPTPISIRAPSETGRRRRARTLWPDVGEMDAHELDPIERLLDVLKLLHAMRRLAIESTERLVHQHGL